MRVYHERLGVPTSWWLLGMAAVLLLATEVVAGFGWPVAAGIYAVLGGGFAAMLLSWGRATVSVGDGTLRAGSRALPVAAAGEVTALDAAQTRAMRGPNADPAAFLLLRPYLPLAVYVEVTGGDDGGQDAERSGSRSGGRGGRRRGEPGGGQRAPYWLIGTRHPERLAAAINSTRPAARADGPHVG
jgi:hypothetical protein